VVVCWFVNGFGREMDFFKMGTVLKWVWVCKLLWLCVGLKRVWGSNIKIGTILTDLW